LKKVLLAVFMMLSCVSLFAQGSAGDQATIEPRYIIDTPTAGMLKRGDFALDMDFFQEGGVDVYLAAGALDRLSFGISFGGSGIIGNQKINLQPRPGVNIKFRLFDETILMPAIALGFDSQGKETYIDSTQRFTIKSRGFYAVGSKNYSFLGNLSIHGGANLSMERGDGDKDMDAFIGAEKSIGSDISFLLEYDFGFNDNAPRSVGQGKGYMNSGLRWSLGNGFTIGFDLKNLARNQHYVTVGNRTIHIEYVRSL
jgi:hypothetical protein